MTLDCTTTAPGAEPVYLAPAARKAEFQCAICTDGFDESLRTFDDMPLCEVCIERRVSAALWKCCDCGKYCTATLRGRYVPMIYGNCCTGNCFRAEDADE